MINIIINSPIRPPGTANCSSFCSANNETIRENIGRHVNFPSLSLETNPGLTSISMPTCSNIIFTRNYLLENLKTEAVIDLKRKIEAVRNLERKGNIKKIMKNT